MDPPNTEMPRASTPGGEAEAAGVGGPRGARPSDCPFATGFAASTGTPPEGRAAFRPPPPGSTVTRLLWAAIGVAVVFNLLASVAMRGSVLFHLATVLSAVLMAEPPLIAFWCVFGPRPFWVRWLQTAGVGSLCFAAGMIGFLSDARGGNSIWRDTVLFFAMAPILTLVLPLPLWLFRAVGFRLVGVCPGDDAASPSPQQFTIGDLLVLTLIVAASLGMAQLGASVSDVGAGDGPFGHWFLVALRPSIAMWIVLMLGTIPCMIATLIAGRLRNGFFGLGIYCFAILLIVVALAMSTSPVFFRDAERLIGVIGILAGFFLVPTCGFLALRAAGVRLVRRTRQTPPGSPFSRAAAVARPAEDADDPFAPVSRSTESTADGPEQR